MIFRLAALSGLFICLAVSGQAPILPDAQLTPGAILTTDANVICHRSTKTVRNVTQAEKDAVRIAYEKKYGIAYSRPYGKTIEFDHEVSLELGGSNDIKNLWPQPYAGQFNARVKDRLENELHRRICLPPSSPDYVPVVTAQHEIETDWIAAYKKYLGTP